MKGIPLDRRGRLTAEIFCSLFFIFAFVAGVRAQGDQPQPSVADPPTGASAAPATAAEPETDAAQHRITRARALAAVGKLAAAASELETLRTSSADESVRDVSRVLLMWIYVEMPDYARASALLDETFKAHEAENHTADRTYFALAGQTINSVRTHLERYRTFGIDVSERSLPAEASSDLEQLRFLLEKVMKHARAIRDEEIKKDAKAKSPDSTALLEDAATVRLRLARNDQEHIDWQREVADARQRLFASETRIASIKGLPSGNMPASGNMTASGNGASGTSGVTKSPVAFTPAPKPEEKPANQKSDGKSKSPANAPTSNAAPQTANSSANASRNSSGPISIGALTTLATQKVSPAYPTIAKSARVSGLVTVYVVVNEKGAVESVQRADGPVQLQSAATEAARRWKFRPTLIDGQPARVVGYISFNFAL